MHHDTNSASLSSGYARLLRAFRGNTQGATAIEYSLIAGAIAVVVIVAVMLTGTNLRDGAYTDITTIVSAP